MLKTFAASKFVGFRINLPEAEECWLGNSFDGTAFAKINGEHSAIQPVVSLKKVVQRCSGSLETETIFFNSRLSLMWQAQY